MHNEQKQRKLTNTTKKLYLTLIKAKPRDRMEQREHSKIIRSSIFYFKWASAFQCIHSGGCFMNWDNTRENSVHSLSAYCFRTQIHPHTPQTSSCSWSGPFQEHRQNEQWCAGPVLIAESMKSQFLLNEVTYRLPKRKNTQMVYLYQLISPTLLINRNPLINIIPN